MDENEILEDNSSENNEEINSEEFSESGSADSENSVSREEIIDIMREIVEEESSEEEISEEESTEEESSEETIDYTPILESILEELEADSAARSAYIESQEVPITDKSLNDFTVTETLLCIVVIALFVKAILKLVDKFTPHI